MRRYGGDVGGVLGGNPSEFWKSELGLYERSVGVSMRWCGSYVGGVLGGFHYRCVSQNWVVQAKMYVLMR